MTTTQTRRPATSRRLWAGLAAAAASWALLYWVNEHVWDLAVFGLLGLDPATRLGHAVHFFLYDTAKILGS